MEQSITRRHNYWIILAKLAVDSQSLTMYLIEFKNGCDKLSPRFVALGRQKIALFPKNSSFQAALALEPFSIECQKWSEVALVLFYIALWLAQKTRATLSTSQAKTKSPPFSRSLDSLLVLVWALVLIGS